jgi:hypothetical protein
MSDARYYVVGDHDVWMIKFQDGEYGLCASREEAVVFAIHAAQKLGMRGECAHVCVVDDDGRLRSKWTYDRNHHLRRSASCGTARPVGLIQADIASHYDRREFGARTAESVTTISRAARSDFQPDAWNERK